MSMLAAVLQARLAAAVVGSTSLPAPPIAVVVDAAVIDGDALAARISAGTQALAYLLPTESRSSASIVITGELLDFRVRLTLPNETDARAGLSSASWCPCTHAELVTHVQRRLAEALRGTPVGSVPRPVIARPRSPAAPPVAPLREGLRPSGRLGVVLVGLGGLGLGAGATALAAVRITDDERFVPRADLRPFGVAALTAGGGALASGALLLLLDRRLRRSRSVRSRSVRSPSGTHR